MTPSELSPLLTELLHISPSLVELRHRLHAHPELSWEENETTALVLAELEGAGLDCRVGPTGTGLIADLVVRPGAPFLAHRADIDALPLADLSEDPRVPRSALRGVMHACGHDVHTAVGVGAALAFARHPGALRHNLRFIFEPAEEVAPGGAIEMVRHGAMAGVQAITALHVDPQIELGCIGLRPGALTAAVDAFELVIRGRGGHSARPHLAVDPILLATRVVGELYGTLPRMIDSRDPFVVTVGRFHAGHAPNVIPDEAEIAGTCRSFDLGVRDRALELVRTLAAAIVEPAGGSLEMRVQQGSPPILNDPAITAAAGEEAARVLGSDSVRAIDRASMGGEDFSEYLVNTPGLMFRLGTRTDGPVHHLHSSHFVADDRAISVGAKVTIALLGRLDRDLEV